MSLIYSVIKEEVFSLIDKKDVCLDNINLWQTKWSTQMVKYDQPSNRIRWNLKSGDKHLTAFDAIYNFKAS